MELLTKKVWKVITLNLQEQFGLLFDGWTDMSTSTHLQRCTLAIREWKLKSRERSKSAPYLRLKNTKRTSKCQAIGELGTVLLKKFF